MKNWKKHGIAIGDKTISTAKIGDVVWRTMKKKDCGTTYHTYTLTAHQLISLGIIPVITDREKNGRPTDVTFTKLEK